ncbi:MAG: putative dimethyl sulfoxide reductase chaperone [Deferribacteres bacterium]|jgi:TorA maturation chaperone TorD|nr:putative dimethyl sulfoxide reductase chaperone [Deferribacteres bacterium]
MLELKVPFDLQKIKETAKAGNWEDIVINFDRYDETAVINLSNILMFLSLAFRYPDVKVYSRLKESVGYFDDFFEEYAGQKLNLDKVDDMQVEYTRLFVTNKDGVPASPYASVYLTDEGLLYSDYLIKLKDLMIKTGFELKEECKDLEDNIYIMLEYISIMIGRLNMDGISAAKGFFLVSYGLILPMCEKFCKNIIGHARIDFYKVLAMGLLEFINDLDGIVEEVFCE